MTFAVLDIWSLDRLHQIIVTSSSRSSFSNFGRRLLVRGGLETLVLVFDRLAGSDSMCCASLVSSPHVFPPIPKDQTGNEVFFYWFFSHDDRLDHQAIFAVSTVLLFFVLRYLDECVTKKDP